jgi:hypothetical protein
MAWLDTHAGSVQAIATLVLVLLTAYYAWTSRAIVRHTQTSLQATARTTLQGRLDRVSELLIEHPDLSAALDTVFEENQALDGRSHLANILWAVLEEAHTQYTIERSMPEEDWQAWVATVDQFLSRPYMASHWRHVSHLYGESFRQFVDSRLPASKSS